MRCPSCDAPFDEGAQACLSCGRSLFALTLGARVAGRYEVVSLLGRGGMGVVYRARDRELGEDVALKVLAPDLASTEAGGQRLRTETRLARRVRHPNVCAIHEYGQDGAIRFLVMELVVGADLRSLLRRGVLPRAQAWAIAVQAAEGLAAIHAAGVVHRDLKASNVMVDEAGRVRLMDFGIARDLVESGGITGTGHVLGTPEYMSPEQARGQRVDARSDLYSLGIVLFEIFTGAVPFRGETPVATVLQHLHQPPPLSGPRAARLPAALVPILEGLLAKEPAQRVLSARQVAQALRAGADQEVPGAIEVEPVPAEGEELPTGPLPEASLAPAPWVATPEPVPEPRAAGTRRSRVVAALAIAGLGTWLAWRSGSAAPEIAAANRARAAAELAEAGRLHEKGRTALALPRLARALRLEPGNLAARSLITDLLLRHPWPLLASEFRHPGALTRAVFTPDGSRVLLVTTAGLALRGFDGQPPVSVDLRGERVQAAAFSADGSRFLTVSEDGSVRARESRDGRAVGPGTASTGTAEFSPDGRRIVVSSADGARLLDVESGRVLGGLSHPGLREATFSPDGRVLATADERATHLWDLPSLRPRSAALPVKVVSLAFDPTSRLLLTGERGGTARLWDVASGAPLGQPLDQGAAISRALFLGPDGRHVATIPTQGAARVWDAQSGKLERTLGDAQDRWYGVQGQAGDRLAFVDNIGGLELWDWRAGRRSAEPLERAWNGGEIAAAWTSPDGAVLRTVSGSGTVRSWRVPGPAEGLRLRHAEGIDDAGFSSDGRTLVTASADGRARLWDTATGRSIATLAQDGEVRAARFAGTGSCLATAASDGTVRLWSAAGTAQGEALRPGGAASLARFSPGGRLLVTASAAEASVWDVASRQPQGPPLVHPAGVDWADVSPDGTLLLTLAEGQARVWDLRTRSQRLPPLPHFGPAPPAFGAGGRSLLVCGRDGLLRSIDLASGRTLAGAPTGGRLLRISADGRRALATSGGVVTIWDTGSGRATASTGVHLKEVLAADLDPAGLRLVTASADGRARLWDAASGAALGEPFVHEGPLTLAAFAPDGSRLLTVSAAASPEARIWDVPLPPAERAATVASLAEAVAGARIAETGEPVVLEDPLASLRLLEPHPGDTAAGILLRLIAAPASAGPPAQPCTPDAEAIPPVLAAASRPVDAGSVAQPLLSISEAAALGDLAAVRAHLDAGLDPSAIVDSQGDTPLHPAAERCQLAVVRLLLERGAKQVENVWNDTPLAIAENRCGASSPTARALRLARAGR